MRREPIGQRRKIADAFICLFAFFVIALSTSCQVRDSGRDQRGVPAAAKTAASDPGKDASPFFGRAVSLRVLQDYAKRCAGECPQEVRYLAGVNTILGYVVDEANRDIVLLGSTDPSLPPLHLDDFVVALRNSCFKYAERKGNTQFYSVPGCSIDFDQGVIGDLVKISQRLKGTSRADEVPEYLRQWDRVCGRPQRVRVMGVPFDSRFAAVMVDADYFMKRLVDGSEASGVEGFTSLTDMEIASARLKSGNGDTDANSRGLVSNRFWFFPGEAVWHENKGIMLIKRFDVTLLTEEQFLTRKGELEGLGRPNPTANRFATLFTGKYAEISKKKPVYAELDGLFRFVGLAKMLREKNVPKEVGINLEYFQNDYPVAVRHVARTLPGVSHVSHHNEAIESQSGLVESFLWVPTCGGVSMDIRLEGAGIKRVRGRDLVELKTMILKGRPSPDALHWEFHLKALEEAFLRRFRDSATLSSASMAIYLGGGFGITLQTFVLDESVLDYSAQAA